MARQGFTALHAACCWGAACACLLRPMALPCYMTCDCMLGHIMMMGLQVDITLSVAPDQGTFMEVLLLAQDLSPGQPSRPVNGFYNGIFRDRAALQDGCGCRQVRSPKWRAAAIHASVAVMLGM